MTTTEDVRRDYREYDLAGGTLEEQDEERARNDARFDHWLAGVKACAFREGVIACIDFYNDAMATGIVNPYKEEE